MRRVVNTFALVQSKILLLLVCVFFINIGIAAAANPRRIVEAVRTLNACAGRFGAELDKEDILHTLRFEEGACINEGEGTSAKYDCENGVKFYNSDDCTGSPESERSLGCTELFSDYFVTYTCLEGDWYKYVETKTPGPCTNDSDVDSLLTPHATAIWQPDELGTCILVYSPFTGYAYGKITMSGEEGNVRFFNSDKCEEESFEGESNFIVGQCFEDFYTSAQVFVVPTKPFVSNSNGAARNDARKTMIASFCVFLAMFLF